MANAVSKTALELGAKIIQADGLTDQRFVDAQNSFWAYCQLMHPEFFRDGRTYLRELAEILQGLYEGRLVNANNGEPYKKLAVSIPPRHGKSFTLSLFEQWLLGKNNENRIITVSYNATLATRFSRSVRDAIDATKIDENLIIFSDVFPATRIKQGDSAMDIWSLEGQYFNYLSAGFGGTITGVGCTIGVIDDPVKNHMEALNERVLDEQYQWYTDTFLSRIEEGGMTILVMTRWSTKDLAGRILESEDGGEWMVINWPACKDEEKGVMLCPSVLSYKSYLKKKRQSTPGIFNANFQGQPMDVQGKLYSEFQTYDELPKDADGRRKFERVIAYVDTADEGVDYLCVIVAGEYKAEAWVLDILFTDAPMEATEPQTAELLYKLDVHYARIESNNGGKGFARNVERLLYDQYGSRRTHIEWFHQSANKHARILAGSTYVMHHLYYPADWARRWPAYYTAMQTYQRQGKNAHDDAPDATTGLIEMIQGDAAQGAYEIYWCGEEE